MKILIFIPAFNEEKNIAAHILATSETLNKHGLNYQLLVVNDGSNDKTQQIVQNLTRRLPIILINHKENQGIRAAFRTGFKTAMEILRGDDDILVVMEADGTSDPNLLPDMIAGIKHGADISIASRYHQDGRYVAFPRFRLLVSVLGNNFLRFFYPVGKAKDYTIFYKTYRVGLLKKAMEFYREQFITARHFAANTEILLHLRRFKPQIVEVAFVYNYGLKKSKTTLFVKKNLSPYAKLLISDFFQYHVFGRKKASNRIDRQNT